MIQRLLIFGAAGDLTRRFLMPALAELSASQPLPAQLSVQACDINDATTESYRESILLALAEHASQLSEDTRIALIKRIRYQKSDVSSPAQVCKLLQDGSGPVAAYLALPPHIAFAAVESLGECKLPPGSRVVVEKPFGTDEVSARKLNTELAKHFDEDAIFRVDHFLAKGTVQNILGLRFANRVFERLWNADQIARVEIVWDEDLALEGRSNYYDKSGALDDMIQNHLLQILALIAMDAPVSLEPADLQSRKLDALRCVRKVGVEEAAQLAVRGRYTAGRLGERNIPNYVDEAGVQASRNTETFAQITLFLDNPRWAGVPFVLRSGKALGVRKCEARIVFRSDPFVAFHKRTPDPNMLTIGLGPDSVELTINTTGHAEDFALRSTTVDACLPKQTLSAYARVLDSALAGDTTLSIGAREAEVAWRIVAPYVEAFHTDAVPLQDYPAGSNGPKI